MMHFLELARLKPLAQTSSQPDRGLIKYRHDQKQQQRCGENHRLGRLAVLTLKSQRVDLKTQMHKGPRSMQKGKLGIER